MVPVFGFTLKQSTPVIYLIFGTMGLGMASPYLVAGLFPAIVNWLPRPGMWMVRFKQFSGFVLMGTVIWLLSTIDPAMQIPTLILLLGAGLGLWMIGNLYDSASPRAAKWKVRAATLVLSLPIFAYGIHLLDRAKPIGKEAVVLETLSSPDLVEGRPDEMPWSPFSEERMIALRKSGQPMLIDFTADWCGICKWNEKWALNTTPVVSYIRKHNITPLLADYTRENEEIRKWLNHFQQDSVPLTVVIPPGTSKIIALRGQYSQHQLLESLKAALGEAPVPTENAAAMSDAAPRSAGIDPSLGMSR
jgi:thiol:disulfide interchange protein